MRLDPNGPPLPEAFKTKTYIQKDLLTVWLFGKDVRQNYDHHREGGTANRVSVGHYELMTVKLLFVK
jgi:hypothetical protein